MVFNIVPVSTSLVITSHFTISSGAPLDRHYHSKRHALSFVHKSQKKFDSGFRDGIKATVNKTRFTIK